MSSTKVGSGSQPGQGIVVREVAVYRGPHLFSRTPMVRVQVDLRSLENYPTNLLSGLTEALVSRLPSLKRHGCSYGIEGGFIRRMEEGTWLGHVAEHVALELQNVAGADVARGKTRSVAGHPGVYNIMFAYEDEGLALLAGRFALELVDALLPAELRGLEGADLVATSPLSAFDLPLAIACLKELHFGQALGPTTRSLVTEAEARNIPWRRMDNSSLIEFGYGRHIRRIRASCTSLTSEIATEIAGDKELTNHLLIQAGLPAPQGVIVTTASEAVAAAERIGFPVVTKPVDGNHGRGVNVNLTSTEDIEWGFEQAQVHSRSVLVEQQFAGADHRILVIGGRLVAAAKRVPAHVVGDGRSTLAQLIEQENQDPRRGEGHEAVLTKITVDECLLHYIELSGLTLESVPLKGQQVLLRPTANLSTGGKAIDCTDIIHPDNALIACRAAQIIGLDIAGIDFIAPDISKSVHETGGGIIEVNAGPGFRMHLAPSEGKARNVAAPVLDLLYPPGEPSRIPILAITGTNGKTTTTRMLAHILAATGKKVGMTTSSGVYIGGQRIMEGDCTGPKSARIVLSDPTVDVAVLETARGGMLREGLAFRACDVGCVTNVTADHLGLRGINSLDDLAEVKAIVVEAVRPQGWSVLNADNPHCAAMHSEAGGNICYFSVKSYDRWPDFLKRHVEDGGRAFACDVISQNPELVLYEAGTTLFVAKAAEFPATMNGMAVFNIENALAASAMAYCHGIPLTTIRSALNSFGASYEQSPGRLNVADVGGSKVIVDYAHNPAGLTALAQLVRRMRTQRSTAIGVIGIAGDRRDEDIIEMGRIAAGIFDRLILKEDEDLRGRAKGEAVSLLFKGVRQAGYSIRDVEVVLKEADAVDRALVRAEPGDLVVVTVDNIDAVWQQVSQAAQIASGALVAPDSSLRQMRLS
jgi:cyanophycin synthetase